MAEGMLYFAYGSNLDWVQMRWRCPSAKYLCNAVLKDHRLAFTRKSENRGCGVADVVSETGNIVWGVVYEVSESDIDALDGCEGFKPHREPSENHYNRKECHVYQEGDDSKPLAVTVYIANKQENPPLPNPNYMDLIKSGAKFWHLPDDYIKELEGIEVQKK